MSGDPVGDIRRWLERLQRDAEERRKAEARSTSGEWSIAPDAAPTSATAKESVAWLLGESRIEWYQGRWRA